MREIQIHLAAIEHNYRALKNIASTSKVMAVVKANAYGHGMVEVAKKLDQIGVDALGVADLEEALALRQAGIKADLMCWILLPSDDFESAAKQNIQLGVSNLEVLERALSTSVADLHIKVDTGLGRGGFVMADWEQVFAMLRGRRVGIFSHLANTSLEDDLAQQEVFEQAVQQAESAGVEITVRHLAATAGTLSYPSMHYDMVRCGIGLYGLNPWDDRGFEEYDFVPVMRASARVVNVKRVEAGQGVSYGYRYKTKRPTTLILVPFGYSEGMPRIAQGAEVLVNGKLFEVSGRIAMDQFVVDVGDHEVSIGDEVVIFGNPSLGEPSADDLGLAAGTINYEVVTRIGGRAKRSYQ